MIDLSNQSCVPCDNRSVSISSTDISRYLTELEGWQLEIIDDVPRIYKRYEFSNFAQALKFTNEIGALAEMENHHPRITTEWGRVRVDWWTHAVKGLHINDFILAARVDKLFKQLHQ